VLELHRAQRVAEQIVALDHEAAVVVPALRIPHLRRQLRELVERLAPGRRLEPVALLERLPERLARAGDDPLDSRLGRRRETPLDIEATDGVAEIAVDHADAALPSSARHFLPAQDAAEELEARQVEAGAQERRHRGDVA